MQVNVGNLQKESSGSSHTSKTGTNVSDAVGGTSVGSDGSGGGCVWADWAGVSTSSRSGDTAGISLSWSTAAVTLSGCNGVPVAWGGRGLAVKSQYMDRRQILCATYMQELEVFVTTGTLIVHGQSVMVTVEDEQE